MRILVLIPAFNEETSVAGVIAGVQASVAGVHDVEIVVVDDGSTDATAARARDAGATVLSHFNNRGLGAAFRTGIHHALSSGAEIVVTLDGDGQFDPHDIPKLIQPLLDGKAIVVTASRFSDPKLAPDMPAIKRRGNAWMARIVSRLSGWRYSDVSCGFRAYTRDALLRLTVRGGFTYTHEVFLDLASKGIRIAEVPVAVRGTREFGDSKIASSVWRYGLRAGAILLGFYRDTHPFYLCLWAALPAFVLGWVALGVSYHEWWMTGRWLKWAGFLGGSLVAFALALGFLGFLLDTVRRIRENQEEILYWLRRSSTAGCAESRSSDAKADDAG